MAWTVSDLSFTYPDADQAALNQINLSIPAPGFTAIAGLSGSGKSSLAALLAGRLTPSKGQITIAGIPLSALSPSAWQKAVTLVTSDSYLFKGSIKDNLLMAGPASDSDLIAALKEVPPLGLFGQKFRPRLPADSRGDQPLRRAKAAAGLSPGTFKRTKSLPTSTP
ncbi:ATP-binding cassette domain-containing protein [Lactobacillus delbrueckii]|uniref:ATP-binding cassette domain-containing protein n=1 Tax=Lactobacillus delbrueckii TaxID=1584 RepID=UPI001E5BBE37|nr:ATP-binding cassette domain-containing protein [Lactobacillus delbrueckii]MCD5514140.1 ATP-binding cassette domain-containing protein [Lactobacillus delbrueckii subsp. lactis]